MTDAVQDEKIQKVLARAGFGSRREMENWITQGRIKINGKTATLGDRAGADDSLVVDGKKVANASPDAVVPRVLIYNKPENEILFYQKNKLNNEVIK
jgi:23S rRNA pseudouridine2605 synthase